METFTLRRHRMVASSNRLCAELPNHRSGGRKRIITLVFSILIVSHDMFLVLTACPAPISDWFLPFLCSPWYRWLDLFLWSYRSIILCSSIACTATSSSMHVLKDATIGWYVSVLTVASLQTFSKLKVLSYVSGGWKVKFQRPMWGASSLCE